MISIQPGAARGVSEQPGLTSLHCFSAGDWYDPDNVAFGPVVGLDLHVVVPGAGFDWHAHRGTHIVSWVLSGVLRHEDSDGSSLVVDDLLLQSTGTGVRHRETNGADTVLRMVQLTVLGTEPAPARIVSSPVAAGPVTVSVAGATCSLDNGLAFCGDGSFETPAGTLWPGDTVRTDEPLTIAGDGRLLVVRF